VPGEPFDGRAARSQQHSIPPHPARSDHGVRRSTMAIELIGCEDNTETVGQVPDPSDANCLPTVTGNFAQVGAGGNVGLRTEPCVSSRSGGPIAVRFILS
jgi:hypothetical protein